MTMKRGQVLLVDDDDRALLGLQAFLAPFVDVVCAPSLAAAWAVLARSRFDVVVTDHQLVGGSGVDVLRRAQAKQGFLWTSRARLDAARADAAAFVVVEKTLPPETLTTLVREAARPHAARSQVTL